ncbi:MAG: hypothetical protein L0229_04685 [Blastocatellia bacterium]|nr:hypothetical protein [Blastocatellia bacterium]
MASALQKYLLAPRVPNVAAGFVEEAFAVVDIRRRRGGFSLMASALTRLPQGLVTPGFDTENIQDPNELAEIIRQTAEAAGLRNKKRWSVALPEGVARTLVVTLESKPASRRELNEVLNWKIERLIAVPAVELRVSRQRISPVSGQERYLMTVARDEVISEYESVFFGVDWQAGLMLPRHIGEAQWLILDPSPGDKMLVSANASGFTSVVVRGGEPVLVRTHECAPDARADELHRFALYYRDRLGDVGGQETALTRLLVLGGINLADSLSAIVAATENEPHPIDPMDFGLDFKGEPIGFDQLAGVAGLASIAWQ